MDTDHDLTLLIVLSAMVLFLVVCYLCIISCEALVSNGFFKLCKGPTETIVKSKDFEKNRNNPLVEIQSTRDNVLSGSTNITCELKESLKRNKKLSTGYVDVLNTLYEPWIPEEEGKQTNSSLQCVVECDIHAGVTKASILGETSDSADILRTNCHASEMDTMNVDYLYGETPSNSDMDRASGIPSDFDLMNRDSLLGKTSSKSDTNRASGIPSDFYFDSADSLFGRTSYRSDIKSKLPSDIDSMTRDGLYGKTSAPLSSDTARCSAVQSDSDPNTGDGILGVSFENTCTSCGGKMVSYNPKTDILFGNTSVSSAPSKECDILSRMDPVTRVRHLCSSRTALTQEHLRDKHIDNPLGNLYLQYSTPRTTDSLSDTNPMPTGALHDSASPQSCPSGPADIQYLHMLGSTSTCPHTPRASGIPSDTHPIASDSGHESNPTYSCSKRAVCAPIDLRHKSTNRMLWNTSDSMLGNTSIRSYTPSASGISSDTDSMVRGTVRGSSPQTSSRRASSREVSMRHQPERNVHRSIFTISNNSWFHDKWEYNPCYDNV